MLAIARKSQVCSVGLHLDSQLGLGDNENMSKLTIARVLHPCAPSSFGTSMCDFQEKGQNI